MQTSLKLKFSPSSVYGKEGRLYIQFIRNRNVRLVATPYSIFSSEWDNKSSAILVENTSLQRERYLKEITNALREEWEAITSKVLRLEKQGDYSLQRLVDFYLKNEDYVLLSAFVNELETVFRHNGQKQIIPVYQVVLKHLLDFHKEKKLFLKKINHIFIQDYTKHLKEEGKSLNTNLFYMRNLKAIYNRAARQDLIDGVEHNIFVDIYAQRRNTRNLDSSKNSFDELLKSDLPVHVMRKKLTSLKFSLDMFIFSYLLKGANFVDLANLKKSDLKENTISYVSQKNKRRVRIKLTPEIQRIIDYYAGTCKNSPYLLPILYEGSSPVSYTAALKLQNKHLKEITEMIQSEEKLTTYTPALLWETMHTRQEKSRLNQSKITVGS